MVTTRERSLTASVCSDYPEEQVEEEQHVFHAADAAASHGRTDKNCKNTASEVFYRGRTYKTSCY